MEFYDLGAHCSMKDCNVQDFLPFTCSFCNHVFCLEHRTHQDHRCKAYSDHEISEQEQGRSAPQRGKHPIAQSPKQPRCQYRTAKCSEPVLMECRECGLGYCVSHRMTMDHECTGKPTLKKKVPPKNKNPHVNKKSSASNKGKTNAQSITLIVQLEGTNVSRLLQQAQQMSFPLDITCQQMVVMIFDKLKLRKTQNQTVSIRNSRTERNLCSNQSSTLRKLVTSGELKNNDRVCVLYQSDSTSSTASTPNQSPRAESSKSTCVLM